MGEGEVEGEGELRVRVSKRAVVQNVAPLAPHGHALLRRDLAEAVLHARGHRSWLGLGLGLRLGLGLGLGLG